MRWPKSELDMKEMLRCLVCGRNAWPTSYAKGKKYGHSIETLVLVKSRGRGKGIEWKKTSRARDRAYMIMWRELLMAHLDRLELLLEQMGETFIDAPEIIQPPKLVARESQVARSSKSFRWSPAPVRMSPSFVRQVPVVMRG
jgi:hypothetical protein